MFRVRVPDKAPGSLRTVLVARVTRREFIVRRLVGRCSSRPRKTSFGVVYQYMEWQCLHTQHLKGLSEGVIWMLPQVTDSKRKRSVSAPAQGGANR